MKAPTTPHRDCCWLRPCFPENLELNPIPRRSQSPSALSCRSFHLDSSHSQSTCSVANSNMLDCRAPQWSYCGRLLYPPKSTAPTIAQHASSAPVLQMHLHSLVLWWLLGWVRAESSASLTFGSLPWLQGFHLTRNFETYPWWAAKRDYFGSHLFRSRLLQASYRSLLTIMIVYGSWYYRYPQTLHWYQVLIHWLRFSHLGSGQAWRLACFLSRALYYVRID